MLLNEILKISLVFFTVGFEI